VQVLRWWTFVTAPAPITRTQHGQLEGFTVLFHDADGNVIGSTKTDAKGRATTPDNLAPAGRVSERDLVQHAHLFCYWVSPNF
jgi:hypothetical protein